MTPARARCAEDPIQPTGGPMIVWITKYALTKGILTGEGLLCEQGSMIEVPSLSPYALFHNEGRDWHRTETDAIAKAEQMRDTTIKSLQKRISRLQKLTFTTTSRRPKKRTGSRIR
jgi:hypothetical protein